MIVQSWGAAREVTGSKHLLNFGDFKVLLDCGLFQGRDSDEKNAEFGFDPSGIDAVILSHAHLDHCGLLPKLVAEGFTGPIYCTNATADIAFYILHDSAHIQESNAKIARKYHRQERPPLYTAEDVDQALLQFEPIKLEEWIELNKDINFQLIEAGHIFGSSQIQIKWTEDDQTKLLTFAGDLGRNNKAIICDPTKIDKSDYLIIEYLYADRTHEDFDSMEDQLKKIIEDTFARNGKVIIPSFALERAQDVIFILNKLVESGRLPAIDVFVDSPLAVKITSVFRKDKEYYDEETRRLISSGDDPFDFPYIHYITDRNDSIALNERSESCVIIASSGMCVGGRIMHHLFHNLSNPKNSLVFVGYNAHGTLGRQLEEGQTTVSLFGRKISVKLEVRSIHGFSAHADSHDLTGYIERIADLKKVFLVHGEKEVGKNWQQELTKLFPKIDFELPGPGEEFDV